MSSNILRKKLHLRCGNLLKRILLLLQEHVMKIKLQPCISRKQNLSILDYFDKMKGYVDKLSTIKHPIDNHDLIILFLEALALGLIPIYVPLIVVMAISSKLRVTFWLIKIYFSSKIKLKRALFLREITLRLERQMGIKVMVTFLVQIIATITIQIMEVTDVKLVETVVVVMMIVVEVKVIFNANFSQRLVMLLLFVTL